MTNRFCYFPLLEACVLGALCLASHAAQPGDTDAPQPTDAVDPKQDTALLESWWQTAGCLQRGQEDWSTCAAILEDAVGANPKSKHVPRCKSLLEGIRLTAEHQAAVPPPDDLTGARLDVSWLYQPLRRRIDREYVWMWDSLSEPPDGEAEDPLVVWFKRGRPAIPHLIVLLDDQRVTRSVSFRRSEDARPIVLRVSDVALGLIEGISRCRFNTTGTHFVQFALMDNTKRRQIKDDIQTWWAATADTDPVEAIVWLAQHSPLRRAEMAIRVLLATGHRDEAIACRAKFYRDNGRIFDNRGNFSFATRLLQAGSREPLDDLHAYIAQNRELEYQHVRMVADFGEAGDAAILEELVYREGDLVCKGKATGSLSRRVANAMSQSDNVHCIPVVMAVIVSYVQCREDDTTEHPIGMHTAIPKYVVTAGLGLQGQLDAEFGLVEKGAPGMQIAALQRMADWWRQEGRSIYGTQQQRPTAPAGVR